MSTTVSVDDLLAKSFKYLVLKRPIEKITIKEITNLAGVIRPTFYNHFQDKYELLEWIIKKELVEPIRQKYGNARSEEALMALFGSILKSADFYSRARRLEGQNSFESIVFHCVKEELSLTLGDRKTELPKEELIRYYAHSITYLILRFIDDGMKKSPEEMVELYRFVKNHSFEDLVRETPERGK